MNINTLHICNLDEVKITDFYQSIIAENDCIIFYANSINKNQHHKLDLIHPLVTKYYMTASKQDAFTTITMKQWVQLVNKAKRTMTWK